jgi:phage tail-like protein
MDANRTRFSLVQGAADWWLCSGETSDGQLTKAGDFRENNNLYFDPQRFELTSFPQLFLFPPVPGSSPLQLEQRRGAARDRFGNWYCISPDQAALLVWTDDSSTAADFWRPGLGSGCAKPNPSFQPVTPPSPMPLELAGLAVTEDHYLVVGVSGPKGQEGYLVFDLAAGGAPQHFLWPATVAFVPFDMAPRAGGGVWILDRENHRYWELDRHFRIRKRQPELPPPPVGAPTFVPLAPPAPRPDCACLPATPIAAADATDVPAEACAIEVASGDRVLLLHLPAAGARFSTVSLYRGAKLCGAQIALDGIKDHLPAGQQAAFSLVAHDFAFVPRAASDPGAQLGRLSVASNVGTQSFAFDVCLSGEQLTLQPVTVYLAMRSFGGKGLVAAAGTVYYDFQDFWLPLVGQKQPTYPLTAALQTRIFDSGQPQCVWHRLLLDGSLPHETEVQVWSRTADQLAPSEDSPPSKDMPSGTPWFAEPPLLRRPDGSEQPFLPTPANPDRGTFELLFQKAQGRYLQLRLQLSSDNGRVTPRLRALRLYYPRFSYLKEYLPAVYRDDPDSASFLDRFLANFEGFYTAIEDRIAAAQALFDYRAAPADTLPWLASWFGVATDPAWNEYKQRVFIQHAMDFFQYRGTVTGLTMALRLVLEDAPTSNFFSGDAADQECARRIRIVERFRTRRTPGVLLGDPTEATGPRLVGSGPRWLPSDGADELHRRYRDFLTASGSPGTADTQFPLIEPTDVNQAALWSQFATATLGFVPSAASNDLQAWQDFLSGRYPDVQTLNSKYESAYDSFADVPLPHDLPDTDPAKQDWTDFVLQSAQLNAGTRQDLWQSFLARRYRSVDSLNTAYGTNWTAFAHVVVPQTLPTNSAALQDWFQFESVVMAMHQTAHKFAVLLPVAASDINNLETRQAQLALAQRVIELEKPAHTMFEVKFYWALFRVGDARLGLDTLVGLGSRAPELLTPMILNQGFLSESVLAPTPPKDTPGRFLVGTDGV